MATGEHLNLNKQQFIRWKMKVDRVHEQLGGKCDIGAKRLA